MAYSNYLTRWFDKLTTIGGGSIRPFVLSLSKDGPFRIHGYEIATLDRDFSAGTEYIIRVFGLKASLIRG